MTTPKKVRCIDVRLTEQELDVLTDLLHYAEVALEEDMSQTDDQFVQIAGEMNKKTLAMFYKKLNQAEADSHERS